MADQIIFFQPKNCSGLIHLKTLRGYALQDILNEVGRFVQLSECLFNSIRLSIHSENKIKPFYSLSWVSAASAGSYTWTTEWYRVLY
jgi:hypothetical protein